MREAVAGCAAGVSVLTFEERMVLAMTDVELAATLCRTMVEADLRRAAAEFFGGLFPEALDPRIRAALERAREALRRFDEALAAAAGLDFLYGTACGFGGLCAALRS